MPLQGLYPPFVLSSTGSGTILKVVENLEAEYSLVNAYDIEYSLPDAYDVEYQPVSEVGP